MNNNNRLLTFADTAIEKLKKGVDTLANAVKVTLGPRGRNVVLEKDGITYMTKDGVTVAKTISLSDPVENSGAQLVKEVALKTAEVAGDGTTTATVLAQSIVSMGIKAVTSGANPVSIKRGMDKACEKVVEYLKAMSIEVGDNYEMVKQVGTISANGNEGIGSLIAEAMEKVGKEGIITLEESRGMDTYCEVTEGTLIERGYVSHHFVTNEDKSVCEMLNPRILVTNLKITTIKDILPILQSLEGVPLLLICDDVSPEMLGMLVMNNKAGKINICVIKAPEFGDRRAALLGDIAAITGGQVASADMGINWPSITKEFFGTADKVLVDKENTTIISGSGKKEAIEERIAQIKSLIGSSPKQGLEFLEKRLARFSGGVGVLYVGAPSEVEMLEKKDRVEDALYATKAAVQEGIVPGGGVAFLRASMKLSRDIATDEDEKIGVDIVRRALESPLRQILENCAIEISPIITKLKESDASIGYNALTNEFEPFMDSGIIDPVKVTRVALEKAVSVAGLILTTGCVINFEKE